MIKAELIQKEEISYLRFPGDDVLNDEQKKEDRYIFLQYAMRYGNTLRQKVKIYFKDTAETRLVETTVWYADDKYAILKSGIALPVKRIIAIEI
jgi:hypothetical protein